MWLLDVTTQQLVHFMDDREVGKYAILSHTWQDEEVTFQDVQLATAHVRQKQGYRKIDQLCQQAMADNLPFAWLDTCCINKESSAELSEAINSMFKWYSNATVCYAYLTDVQVRDDTFAQMTRNSDLLDKATQYQALLRSSRWLTRGWTLQELIAPNKTVFYDKNWRHIGDSTISALQVAITDMTGIDTSLLRMPHLLRTLPVAKRLSWAAHRYTTRQEDQAYSLLGILGLNMALLYGEGSRALLRLQEAVLQSTTDQSILHWRPSDPDHVGMLFAPHISCFEHCGKLLHRPDVFEDESHEVVSNGLKIRLPMRSFPNETGVVVAALNCTAFTRQREQAVLELRNIRPMHPAKDVPRHDIFEVVRDQFSPVFQPQSDWRNSKGNWKADVALVNAIVLKHSVSSVLKLDDDEQMEVLAAHPPHCWDKRRRQFFVLGDRASGRGSAPSGFLHLRPRHTSVAFYLFFSLSRFRSKYSLELTTTLDDATATNVRRKLTLSIARLVLATAEHTVSACVLEADGSKQDHNAADTLAPTSLKFLQVRMRSNV